MTDTILDMTFYLACLLNTVSLAKRLKEILQIRMNKLSTQYIKIKAIKYLGLRSCCSSVGRMRMFAPPPHVPRVIVSPLPPV